MGLRVNRSEGNLSSRRKTLISNHLWGEKKFQRTGKIASPYQNVKETVTQWTGNYSGVRLLEHGMKVYKYVLERRLRKIVNLGRFQFGFRQGKSTIDAIFIMR